MKLNKFYDQNLKFWKTVFCKILKFTVFFFNLDLGEDKIYIEFFTLYREKQLMDLFTLFKNRRLCQRLPWGKSIRLDEF